MKRVPFLLTAFALIAMTSCTQTSEQVQTDTAKRDYFQLKIFSFESQGQDAMLDSYF